MQDKCGAKGDSSGQVQIYKATQQARAIESDPRLWARQRQRSRPGQQYRTGATVWTHAKQQAREKALTCGTGDSLGQGQ